MRLSNSSDFPTTSNTAPRSLRHLPRDATGHGLRHTTIIIIVASASVGSLLLAVFFWHVFWRRWFARSRSTPLPPRQGLVHQRELELAAFTEYKNSNLPRISLEGGPSSTPIHHGSNSSFVPHIRDSPASTLSRAPSFTHETDEGNDAGPPSNGNYLHPPPSRFSPSHIPASASATSLPSLNGRSSPSSEAATSPTPFPSSLSPTHSFRRPNPRFTPRPFSTASAGTTHSTTTTRSRQTVRGAPHAPHNNVQIVLPAPLAGSLHDRPASAEPRDRRTLVGDSVYADSWRSSLVDTWISVGQHGTLEPETIERKPSRDRTERPSRRECAALSMVLVFNP
ncbi:hypothetical protein BC826DRAFT_219631 [Russula brevipes]|nr:hypothetical protein BC826DRAFT_219631 [Russula brevipes]